MIEVERRLPHAHHVPGLPEHYRVTVIRGSLGIVEGYQLVLAIPDGPERHKTWGVRLPDDADSVRAIAKGLLDLADKIEAGPPPEPEVGRG